MQIQSTGISKTIPLTSVIRGSTGTNHISLPVHRSQALYARFKHITGRPDPSGGGYPITKLRSLDNLIDRLVKLKDSAARSLPKEEEMRGISGENLDALIQDLSQKPHSAYLKAEANPYLSLGTATGIVADINL